MERKWIAAMLLPLWVGAAWSAAFGEPPASPEVMLRDAELADVFFADAQRGWAVGDRGVIWHTQNGGRDWALQRSPAHCRLESVFFLDAERGWIVGGWPQPQSTGSKAVVLRTQDGGKRWVRTPMLLLPALKHVVFFDAKTGYALGESSPLFPSGVFHTSDGGRSWSTLPSGSANRLLTGDFSSPRRGVVAGRDGQLQIVSGPETVATRTSDLGDRGLRRLVLNGPAGGWLVGDGGLVLTTIDGGLSWRDPVSPPPVDVTAHFDFAALAVRGSHCWIAGAPGSLILHSADAGATWETHRTNWPLPIRGLHFVDEQQGWAVGALGAILHTRDGGRSWTTQQSGGSRVAMLGVFSAAEQAPPELLAQVAGQEGYLSQVQVLFRRDLEQLDEAAAALTDRLHAAVVQAGGSGGATSWRFPLRQSGLEFDRRSLVAMLNRASDGRGLDELEAFLVLSIRQWRPDLVLTEDAGDSPIGQLTQQTLLAAVQKAGDPTVYSDQLTIAGLQPWEVKRVARLDSRQERASCTITTNRLAPLLGQSIVDYAARSRGLLDHRFTTPPAEIGLETLVNRLPVGLGAHDLFRGLQLPLGGEARRNAGEPFLGDLVAMHRRIQKRRNVTELLRRGQQQHGQTPALLGQLSELTEGLDAAGAAQIIQQLADSYQRRGKPDLAADALRHLVTRFPENESAEAALRWLIQYYASEEAGWRLRRSSHVDAQQLELRRPDQVTQAGAEETVGFQPKILQLGGRATASMQWSAAQRATEAVALGELVQRTRPELHSQPSLRLPLAVAQSRQGASADGKRYLHALAANETLPVWRRCAQSELWMEHLNGRPPKPTTICLATAQKPRLDGRLEDPVWRSAKPLPLASPLRDDDAWPASAMLAYDEQYLYLAVHCRKATAAAYPRSTGPRRRDPEMRKQDRVELFLDVDRDFATYYHFVVDHRGWVGESCLGDAAWNPQWYVAAASDAETWTVEAAIPFEQLSGSPPPRETRGWAVGCQRIVPNVGFQAWTQPAAVRPRPEGFGLLLFQGPR